LRAGATSLALRVEEGLVELTQSGLDSEDDISGFESSWNTALALLELAVIRHPRRERSVRWFFQEVPATAELLHFYFTDKSALGTWLGSIEGQLTQSQKYHMELFGGAILSGEVLHDARDVCLHVSEWNHGAMALRGLPGPASSQIAANGVSTWDSELPLTGSPSLEGALNRLAATTMSRDG
jgi:hypothetical protein